MIDEIFDQHYTDTKIQGGTTCCPGCGGPLFWKIALQVLGPNTIVYGDGPCAMCALRNIKVPHYGIHFSFVADGATGIAAALRAKGRGALRPISYPDDAAIAELP
nr:hypothetical protein [Candidatus Bathyarchaeota archaeon]